jgi:hypothetical protein
METSGSAAIYPSCPVVARTLQVGGQGKAELLDRLARSGVELNEAGRVLFASDRFMTSDAPSRMRTAELSVRDLGFPHGTTLSHLYVAATHLGLKLCPVELGPHLRLQFLGQPEGFLGQPVWQNRAPAGAITIASEVLCDDDDAFPKGFYLRRIEGTLWLRGYRCGREHVWDPEDRLVFCEPGRPDDAG